MTDFEKLLNDVLKGKGNLAPLRGWLDKNLSKPGCDHATLLASLEKAESAGLSEPVARAIRTHIESAAPAAAPAGGDFPFELEEQPNAGRAEKTEIQPKPSAEKTQLQPKAGEKTQLQPKGGEKTQITAPANEATRRSGERTMTAPGGDRTTIQQPAGEEGSITMRTDKGRTVITRTGNQGEDPTTNRGATRRVETDPFAMDSQPTSGRTGGPTTGTSWRTSSGLKASGGGDNLGPGSVLKDRFELMDVLGEGGMGKVYKARDLLKVEAKDKNPYIAVKTLTGDFKQHPESFIALQRESSKAQRLAHPNIATVYDFDRDGGTVYMTMELMEGDELAKYIKHLPAGGLPVPEAMHIIKQLCDGLAYAHSKQLVHSDFKPGNAFLTKDGTVKLLDFGIARASKTRKDTVGETTVFDPGQLGALTPAYATVEMFEGMDPDPRDDIYALAAVAYELLTGKHPFNKLSAPKVLEKGLKPALVPKVTSRQNKALFKALALRRDDRTATVEEFWDELRPRKSRTKEIVGGSIAAVLVLVLALYSPIVSYIHARRDNQIVAQIEAGTTDIPATLKMITTNFKKDEYQTILDNAKDKIIKYYEKKAEDNIDQTKGQYNYAVAEDAIKEANTYYPDSAELAQEKVSLDQRKATLISQLTTEFNSMLTAGKLMPTSNGDDITGVVKILRVADPANSMLKDARLANRYAQMVQSSVGNSDYAAANNVLKVGLDYAPTDSALLNLQDQVKRELKREQDAQLIAQLESKLKDATPGMRTLADFDKVREQMQQLHGLNPGDVVIQRMNDPLKAALSSAINTDAQQKKWEDAEKALYAYSHLLPLQDVLSQRQALNQAEVSASYVPADLQTRLTQIKQHRDSVEGMLGNAKYDSDWDNQLLGLFQETTALLQPSDMDWYAGLRDNVAKTYIKLSQQMIQQSRFDAAQNLLASGKLYSPQLADFDPAEQALASAQDAFKKAQAEKLRVASIDASKNQFQTQLNAGQIDDAKKTYAGLQQSLPANDPFFSDTAPKAYALAYLNLAKGRATNNDFRGAVALIKTGLQYAPLDDLKKALSDYQAQQSKGDLLTMVDTLQASGMGDLKAKLADVQKQFPRESQTISDNLVKRLAQHIDGLKDTDAGLAYDLWNAAKAAFPEAAQIQNLKISPPARPSKFAGLGRDAMKQNLLTKAQGYADQGNQQEAGNQDLAQFEQSLQKAQADATQYFVAYQQYQQAGQTQQAQQYLAEAIRRWADNPGWLSENKKFTTTQQPVRSANGSKPCTSDLAAYGRSGRAECYDMIDGSIHGPTMVVVPAGGNQASPFAIGKYEVSVGDLNAYCKSSGQCNASGDNADMPATSVSFATAKAYAAWLTQKSGIHYYIPSQDQWQYAASAGGTDTNRDFNCHVTLGDQVIKGLSIVSVSTGKANNWGLVNAVGNVQQFVTTGAGVGAAGGDYQDPLADCTTSLIRPSNGTADPLTGFRVARDLNQ
ncbi:MAG: bifunctional serine/threonine-protein kinase/formylglycine-generating enzyme family protein [Bacillota bacterium]